ncbi:MAG: CBS domain-containing protein [Nanoarchaeota archaeon]|nr:CBS domain-containing protein [Nanoarchaeota archaeon]
MGYKIRAKEVMSRKPKFVSPDTSIAKAARLMARNKIGSVLVLDRGTLVGIVTEGDILRRAFIKNKHPTKTKVREIMSKKVLTISPNDDISAAAKLMNSKGIKRLPVVDGGRVVGILSEKDLLKIEPSIIDVLIEKLKIREPTFKLTYYPRG